MNCPFCRHDDSASRRFAPPVEEGTRIRRRRERSLVVDAVSPHPRHRSFSSSSDQGPLSLSSREKVTSMASARPARAVPVNDDDLALLAQRVEEALRSDGQAEVEAQEVGMAILAPLREFDEVAYLRYASVYRNFASLEDFEGEIALLRAAPSPATRVSPEVQSTTKTSTEQTSTENELARTLSPANN
jgi:transcriptional repressor NrdR